MGCPRNLKKWWFIHWEGPHKIDTILVRQWAFGEWQLDAWCQLCGDHLHNFGLKPSELIRFGLEPKEGTVQLHDKKGNYALLLS